MAAAGAGPSLSASSAGGGGGGGGGGGAARELSASESALLYQIVVAAQFLEDAQMNSRLVDKEYTAEAKKLRQQWRKLVDAKGWSDDEAALAVFRRESGLDDWTDLGWRLLVMRRFTGPGGVHENDTGKIAELVGYLAEKMDRFYGEWPYAET